jgi:diglucosylglycerate octanoyltransferase
MSSEQRPRPTLLVFADSLAYYGPTGGLPADDPRIWPNIVAAQLGWELELIGRIGWTCRDVWWAATQDPRAWAALPRAGAVVFATGGMDSLPSPLPTALRELIRYVRPPWLRRWVRDGYGWLQPRLSPVARAALPPHLSAEYLEETRGAIDFNRPGIPIVASLPSVHIAETYGKAHRGRAGTVAAITQWASQHDVPLVDLKAAVAEHVMGGRGNPDGIHWNFEAHQAVAELMLKALDQAGVATMQSAQRDEEKPHNQTGVQTETPRG